MDESVLKVTIDRSSETQQHIKGEVAWSEVSTKLDEAFRELGKEVSMRGFRKGKVPRGLLDKMLGGKVREEVARNLVQEALADIVNRHKIKIVAPPSEWDIVNRGIKTSQPLEFEARMEVLPLIKPKEYLGVELEEVAADVTDNHVEEVLKAKQRELTQYRTMDRTTIQAGDYIMCDIMGKVGFEPIDIPNRRIFIPKAETEQVFREFREPIPGLAGKLIGVDTTVGDLEIDLQIPDNSPEGKKAHLMVSFSGIQEAVIPELDDELAREAGEADSLEDYRGIIRKKLEEKAAEDVRSVLKTQLLEKIRKLNPVELTERLVGGEAERIKRNFGQSLGPELMSQLSGPDSNLDELFSEQATHELHNTLLLDAIATQEGIETTEEDLEKHIEKLAQTKGENTAKVRANLEKKGMLTSVRLSLREEKTVDLLLERACVKPKRSDEEEQKVTSEPSAEEPPAEEPAAEPEEKKVLTTEVETGPVEEEEGEASASAQEEESEEGSADPPVEEPKKKVRKTAEKKAAPKKKVAPKKAAPKKTASKTTKKEPKAEKPKTTTRKK